MDTVADRAKFYPAAFYARKHLLCTVMKRIFIEFAQNASATVAGILGR
jgi:hypothetical protein